ncbi:MAG: hypothetical protein JWP88_1062 [Flaviaesturariibacter sp.]|nr:hypothetical protein [Flaviaesturariibacter sp.]
MLATVAACSDNTSSNTQASTDSVTRIDSLTDTAALPAEAPPLNDMKAEMALMMQQMHHMQSSGNNDIDFAAMMIKHHEGAVEMSKAELKSGTNPELKSFAQKVIADQQKEIGTMQAVLANAPKDSSTNAKDFAAAMKGSMMPMMGDPGNFKTTDQNYAANMIPHHQSAVEMAKIYVRWGTNPVLNKLSASIVASQAKEVEWLKAWLKAHQ